MRKHIPIFFSALMLTGVNLLLRLFGTGFQVYLSGQIGAEGIGLLQLTLSAGSMAMVAGMGGIRTATMYLSAEELGKNRPKNIPSVLAACTFYSICFSLCIATLLYVFAPFIGHYWIGNAGVTDSLRLFCVFLPVNCLCGVMIGYFTGANRIGTLAAIEVAEQIFSMVITVLLLKFYAKQNQEAACLCVVFGSGLGGCFTLLVLTLVRCRDKVDKSVQIPITRRLLRTALPLAAADDLRTGISTLENMMVPRRLALYPDTLTPLAAFGTVTGMVFPILMFPAAFLFGLTELLVPELARCNASGRTERIDHLVRKSMKSALIYGAVCAGVLYLTAPNLCMRFYGSSQAGEYLRWFSLLAIMLYTDSVVDAMIKGLGQQSASVCFNIITNIMDVALLYVLLPILGMKGYFISFLITHGINLILSLWRLLKITHIRIHMRIPVFTLLVLLLSIAVASFCTNPWIASLCFIAIFFCGLYVCAVITMEDFNWIKGLLYKK